MVKEEALNRCKNRYILSDKSKFDQISSITFGQIRNANIITTTLEDRRYKKYTEVKEVSN